MSKTAAERQRDSRRRKPDTDVTKNVTCHETDVTPVTENVTRVTADRTQDQSLPMTAGEVLARRDGYKGVWPPDPLAIPGDPDYFGVCKQVDGVWQVKPDPVDMHALTYDDLIRRLHCIRDWKHSPEHQEVLRRRNEVAA